MYLSVFFSKHPSCPEKSFSNSLVMNHYGTPQEFLLEPYILDYRYYNLHLFVLLKVVFIFIKFFTEFYFAYVKQFSFLV